MSPHTFAAETAAAAHLDRYVSLALIDMFCLIMQNRKILDDVARGLVDMDASYEHAVVYQEAIRSTANSPLDRRYFEQRLAHHEKQVALSKRSTLRVVHSRSQPPSNRG